MANPHYNPDRIEKDCFCRAIELVLHDMKQPLHAARLRSETLMLRLEREAGPVSPAATRQEMEPILVALHDMNALLRSVMDVMRAEAGEQPSIQTAPADLNQLLRQTVQPFQDRAVLAGVHLALTMEPPLPDVHWLHRQLRCHVLNNLLANALQASPRGARIEVSARALGDHVEIRVSDEGPGIPANLCSRIFERYHSGSGHEDGGHIGMGLHSALLFTRLHRGELHAEDGAGGRGTTLVLRLPARPFGGQPAAMPEAARGGNPDTGCEAAPRPAGLTFQASWPPKGPTNLPLLLHPYPQPNLSSEKSP